MYDALSADYDYFVNWAERLKVELPFLQARLDEVARPGQAVQVLDAACGTGMHTIALAQRGYAAAGTDLSAPMIEKARLNAQAAGVNVRFEALGFGQLAAHFQGYDAVLCLGNSLPHVLQPDDLAFALADFGACLRPGGRLIIQNRNFDQVLAGQARWMGPEAHREGEREWLFVRFYDFDPDGRISFNILTLYRDTPGAWMQRVTSTRLWPLRHSDLAQALTRAGFADIQAYGNLMGEPFDAATSGNLVLVASKPL